MNLRSMNAFMAVATTTMRTAIVRIPVQLLAASSPKMKRAKKMMGQWQR